MIRKEIISHALGAGVKKEIHAHYIKRFRICKWTSIHGKFSLFSDSVSNVILKERKISDLTVYSMISFEKINFCAIASRWISLKAARSEGSNNFWQGGDKLILFVYLYLVRINIKTEFCPIWSRNPRIFPY